MRGRKPVSRPSDPEVSRLRIEAAFREAERGEELIEKEITSARRETAMNRCRGSRARAFLRPEAEGRLSVRSFAGGSWVVLRWGLCR